MVETVSESAFEYLLIELVHMQKQLSFEKETTDAIDTEAVFNRLEAIGYRVGYALADM